MPQVANAAILTQSRKPWDMWKNAFESMFPQKPIRHELQDDASKDAQFKEASIDALRAFKDQELERYMRQRGRAHETAPPAKTSSPTHEHSGSNLMHGSDDND